MAIIQVRRFLAVLRAWLRYRANRKHRQRQRQGPLTLGNPIVINLPTRPDRLSAVSAELAGIGFPAATVFPGVPHENGALGCGLAHRNLLDTYSTNPHQVTWVVEDDLIFEAPREDVIACVREFVDNPGLDVLCLSQLTDGPTLPISRNLALTVSTITTACYLVKPWAIAAIRQSFHESVVMLSLGVSDMKGGIDIHWKSLQFSHLAFCVPRRRLARQAASFSDIRRKHVDYYRPRAEALADSPGSDSVTKDTRGE